MAKRYFEIISSRAAYKVSRNLSFFTNVRIFFFYIFSQPSPILEFTNTQFHFRCLSDSLFHRHDLLWDPSVFSRSSHWSISGIRRNDFGGTAVSPFERRWNSNYVPGVFLGHLLLCYYSMDIFLHDSNFYSHPRTSMGYLW